MSERLRILIVEDNPADVDFIHEMVSQAGSLNFQVESVPQLSEAITRLKRRDIDLVLLDLGLPDSQGLQTFHTLQKAEPDIPVIVLTGNDDHELAIAAMREGAQDYLVKGQIDGSLLVRTARYAVERKQAEQRLQMFQFATDQADDAVFWMDRDAGFYYVNDQACRSLGYTREELMRLRLFDIDPNYPKERWEADWAQFHEKRIEVQRLESFHRRKDGVVFPIEVVGKQCWFGDTELHVAYVRDISERKRAEETLRESEARYRTLFDESADGILIADVETKTFKYANPAMCRMLGYTEDELRTTGVPDIHPKDALQKILAEFEAQARGNKTTVTDIPCLRKDGSVVHVDINGVTIIFDGRPCNVGFFRDITERKQAAQRITDALNFNQTMLRASPVGIVVFKATGRCVSANEAIAQIIGGLREEVLKQNFRQLESWKNSGMLAAAEAALAAQMERKMEAKCVTTFGRKGWFFCRFVPFHYEGELHLLVIISDITERKRAEEALQESRQMLRSVLDTIPVRVFWKDLEGQFAGCNQPFARDAGFDSPEALMGKTDYDMGWKAQADLYRADDQQVITSGVPKLQYEELQTTPAGTQLWLRTSKIPLRDLEGRIIGVLGTYEDITERKQAEEAVRESKDYLEKIINSVGDPMFVKDRQHRLVLVNEAECRLAGRTREELLGKTDYDFFPKEQVDVFWQNDELVFETGQANVNEETITDAAGELRTIVTKKSRFISPSGQAFIVGVIRDITERKQVEEEVARTAREWQTTFDATRDAIWILDQNHRILRTNKTAEKYFQRPCSKMMGKPCWEIVHCGAEPIPDCPFGRARKSGHRETMDLQMGLGWFEVIVDPILDAAGQFAGAVHIVSDITERKRAEEALRKSRTLYYSFVESLPIGIFRKDRDGRFILVNPEFCRFKGMKAEEFLGKTPREVAAGEAAKHGAKGMATKYAANGTEHHEQILQTGKPIDVVEEYIHADGGRQFLHVIKLPVVDHDGKIIGTQGIQFDITELKLAEERIREQAALLDAANDAIYVRSLDDAVTYWNDGSERLYGWTRAEALGRKIHDLIKYDRDAFETAQAALLAQGNWSGELKMTNKTDKAVTVFCRWTLLRDESGHPKEILAINTDITERKQLEVNFLRAQRMEGIGALAGGIAHDLNNILQPILMTAPFLRETTSDPESRGMLDTVENCAQRGADIIKQLLTFARGQPSARVPLPVRHLMSEMSQLIHETFPKNIQTRVNVPKDLWQVLGDATQIHQALMNLCVNARDAMPNGGTLTLTAVNLFLDEAFATMMPNAKPGPHICVSVADTGMGIPPEHLERIFDPFFTTKEIGKGTGLGLATVLGIARGHGGFVKVNSQTGKGTIFEIYLPASPEAKVAALSERETLPPRAGGELILVVDDEADVRSVVRRTLEKHGYRVVTAVEGAEAMGLFAQHRAEIRAVLTDMMMPDMDGPSLVRALRHLDPQLPILGMSGVGEKADIKGLETLDLLVLLTKPFNIAELLGVLHQALAAPRKGNGKP